MTFDPSCSGGAAVVVPCAFSVARPKELVDEAEALWAAEQPGAVGGALGAAWGCVGVLFPTNPPDEWRNNWSRAFQERAPRPIWPIDDHGMLQIPWPMSESRDGPALDFLLATATLGECTRPTPEAVADAWIDQRNGYERYFFENVRHGIRTSEDLLIWDRMSARQPPWLDDEGYATAIAILTQEQQGGA